MTMVASSSVAYVTRPVLQRDCKCRSAVGGRAAAAAVAGGQESLLASHRCSIGACTIFLHRMQAWQRRLLSERLSLV